MTINIDTNRLRGVVPSSTYLAQQSFQGGRAVYSIRLPLADLPTILPVPSPDQPDEDNRKVDAKHARDFGEYLDTKRDWVAPALLARDNGGCTFKPIEGSDGKIGYLEVPWAVGTVTRLSTIDGQHRVLGVHLEQKRITEEIADIDRSLLRMVSPEKIAKANADKQALVDRLERLKNEWVGLDIYVEQDNLKARQMFVDVADNAKGISAAVRARFDAYKVANRTLSDVMRHPMLKGRVDPEQDRMTSKNPNFIGAKHVADITRAVLVGPGGRIGKKVETEISDTEVIEAVKDFLDIISTAFTDLADMTEDKVPAATVRERSLLGSVGMLRVLAGAFRDLREARVSDEDITIFFKRLDPHMAAPVTDRSIWRTVPEASENFELDAKAPVMRQQNLVALTKVITSWYKKAPAGL